MAVLVEPVACQGVDLEVPAWAVLVDRPNRIQRDQESSLVLLVVDTFLLGLVWDHGSKNVVAVDCHTGQPATPCILPEGPSVARLVHMDPADICLVDKHHDMHRVVDPPLVHLPCVVSSLVLVVLLKPYCSCSGNLL